MYRSSFLIASADLLVLFLYGAAICYFKQDFLNIDATTQTVASAVLAFVLGCFGPRFSEILEWALFFCLGVIAVSFYPYAPYIENDTAIPIAEMIATFKYALYYCMDLLKVWFVAMPVGIVLHKITTHNFYRNHHLG